MNYFENPSIAQPLRNFKTLYGTVFTRSPAVILILSQINQIYTNQFHPPETHFRLHS
jgi:hypothetical protein